MPVQQTGRMTLELRRAADRFVSSADGIESRHSLSFGEHYDPDLLRFGALIACNEERVPPGAGFAEHPHRHVEIVTWVFEGTIEHRDDAGHESTVSPGQVQYLAAGAGVRHSERNAAHGPAGATARFVQFWLEAGESAATDYRLRDVTALLGAAPALVAVSRDLRPDGEAAGAVTIARPGVALRVARLVEGDTVTFPAAPRTQLLVGRGRLACDIDDEPAELAEGDELKLTGEAPPTLIAIEPAEVLGWELRA